MDRLLGIVVLSRACSFQNGIQYPYSLRRKESCVLNRKYAVVLVHPTVARVLDVYWAKSPAALRRSPGSSGAGCERGQRAFLLPDCSCGGRGRTSLSAFRADPVRNRRLEPGPTRGHLPVVSWHRRSRTDGDSSKTACLMRLPMFLQFFPCSFLSNQVQ